MSFISKLIVRRKEMLLDWSLINIKLCPGEYIKEKLHFSLFPKNEILLYKVEYLLEESLTLPLSFFF